jgi:hypothetical protein
VNIFIKQAFRPCFMFQELIFVCHVKDGDESMEIHFRGVGLFKDFVWANQTKVGLRLKTLAKHISLRRTKR